MKKLIVTLFIALSVATNAFALPNPGSFFVENRGQWSEEVQFRTVVDGSVVWITDSAVVSDYYSVEADSMRLGHVIGMTYKGHTSDISYEPQKLMKYYESYFTGSKFIGGVKCAREIIQKDVYEDIDIRYYFDSEKFRYDFIVNPGADPNDIELCFNGQSGLAVDKHSIKIETRFGEVSHSGLMAYTQNDNQAVECSFQLSNNTVKFNTDFYKSDKTLIIDPVVSCTVFGKYGEESLRFIRKCKSGHLAIMCRDLIHVFPLTDNVYVDPSEDVSCIVKTSFDMQTILFSYKFPLSKVPEVGITKYSSFQLDNEDNIFIVTVSKTDTMYVSDNAYQKHKTPNDIKKYDIYVYKINSGATSIMAATYLGNIGIENCVEFKTDRDGNPTMLIKADSSCFPTTENAYIKEYTTARKNVWLVAKLSNDLSELLASTYLTKTARIAFIDFNIDTQNNMYFCGARIEGDCDITTDAYKKEFDPNLYLAGYLCRLSHNGSSLEYGSYLDFMPRDIAVDSLNHVYVCGVARKSGLATKGAFDEEYGGYNDLYFCKFQKDMTELEFGTYLGGERWEFYLGDYGIQIDVDINGKVYIAGSTFSPDFPCTDDALKNFYISNHGEEPEPYGDMTFSVFNENASELIYSTYIGGGGHEEIKEQIVEPNGRTLIVGKTFSTTFITTDGSQGYGGYDDVFVFRYQNGVGVEGFPIHNQDDINIYPNPVSSQATIKFRLESPALVKCDIFDVFGRKVAEVVSTQYPAGENTILFSKGDLGPAVYFVVLNLSDGQRIEKKFVIE
ncbi:MAG: T9SS type A sorting domain-containing protein [Candidatus Kapabacteria bacterium]|jgi:hypothetical protein|nr:T9SS type A sorting domain-containing protein [Candidatus Kapabacteria bacterium]